MKKIFSTLLISIFSLACFAQDKGGELKNMRFGVTVLPTLNWYKPDDPKKFKNEGVVARIGVLLNGEYSFGSNFAIGFGIGLGSSGGKINFTGKFGNDTARYYFNDNDGIISLSDTSGLKGKYEHYRLITRTYNASYFMIPVSLKMRTNEIGYMRYFFEPRLNINVRKKVRAKDNVFSLKPGGQSTLQEDLDITKDMSLLRLSVTLSGGGEYYLSGSTAIVFAIGYDYGLSNAVQKDSEYLLRPDSKAVEQKFTQNGLVLSLGILF